MKKLFIGITALILFAAALSFSVLASTVLPFEEGYAVDYEDGKITGLKAEASYEYTYVTLENYNSSLESINVTNSKFESANANESGVISEINDPGIIFLRNKDDYSEVHYVFIEGDPLERSVISEPVLDDSGKSNIPVQSSGKPYPFLQGKWVSASIHVDGEYLTTNATHVSAAYAENIYDDLQDDGVLEESLKKELVKCVEGAYFLYSYLPHEILPIEELYTITYEAGYFQSSINISSPSASALKTKLVLYTLDDSGIVKKNVWTGVTSHPNSSSWTLGTNSYRHTIPISSCFSDVSGYVLGFEIYPYGELPSDVTFSAYPRSDGIFIGAKYSVKFVPSGYTTKWLNDRTILPYQYNGANSAYISGYGNGLFAPDETITRAEISSIVLKLITDASPVGNVSKYNDVIPGEWYYEAIAYLETLGVFDYLTKDNFYPNEKITRGELTRILSSLVEASSVNKDMPFKDVEEHAFEASIKLLYDLGAINGYGDNTFRPNDFITRAEAVAVINRLINLTVNDETVIKNLLPQKFSDISGHWAENHVLMASNDNVKTKAHLEAKKTLSEDADYIYFETKLTKVKIAKNLAKVEEFIYKATGENVLATSLSPFFATITSKSGMTISPTHAEIVDKRLHVVFADGTEAYFIIAVYDNFFTVTLDSEVPVGISSVNFAFFSVNTTFSTSDENSFRLSNVSMDTRLSLLYAPGGSSKRTGGFASSSIGDVIGAKLAVAFSKYGGRDGLHRSILKEITDKIDPNKGIKSKAGGAYALDNPDIMGDYAIIYNLSSSNVDDFINSAKKASLDLLDLHHVGHFSQGDFNFKSARTEEETEKDSKNNTLSFTDGATFKKRIADKVHDAGLKLALHTYSTLVGSDARKIVTDPKWQKQLHYKKTYTLRGDLSIFRTNIKTYEDCSDFTSNGGVPYDSAPHNTSQYVLIDEEIILITQNKGTTSGFLNVRRGQLGTKVAKHKDGAEIRHLSAVYGCFVPILGSDLFWHVADETARAYNEGDFDMIYFDGFEGFTPFNKNSSTNYYYYSEFCRRVLSQCIKTPMVESSAMGTNLWAAGGRIGAIDAESRAYKVVKKGHYQYYGINATYSYNTITLGWFNFSIGGGEYSNTIKKTLFRDDIDYLGKLSVMADLSCVQVSFSPEMTKTQNSAIRNVQYYAAYKALRNGRYFSDDVKEALKNSSYEHRLVELDDGRYGFMEMYYESHKINNATEKDFISGSATNPFSPHTPFIRIEQRYSTLEENAITLLELDETKDISAVKGTKAIPTVDLTKNMAFKVKVYGNGKNGAVLVSLASSGSNGRSDYFISTDFTGWREFIFVEIDNAEYLSTGHSFSQAPTIWSNWATYGADINRATVNSVMIGTSGDVSGVKIDDIRAYAAVDAPAKNPSVKIGSNTITFEAEVRSGEYIEFYPDKSKAYLNYYEKTYDEEGNYVSCIPHAKEISYSGSVTVPSGSFSYSYGAENSASSSAPLRAKVVIGMQGKVITNPSDWAAPKIDMENATLDVILN